MRPAGVAYSNDPYFSYVVDLIHLNGTNGSTTITQEISGGPNWVQSGPAGAAISTAQSLFGGASWRATGSLTSKGYAAAGIAWGSGDFAIEFAGRFDGVSVAQVILDYRPTATTGVYPVFVLNASGFMTYSVNAVTRITSGTACSANTWYRWALCRVSGNSRLYQNGTQVGSTYVDANNYLAGEQWIGVSAFSTAPMTGYVDELRGTKGIGRYSGTSYTLDTGPFPNA